MDSRFDLYHLDCRKAFLVQVCLLSIVFVCMFFGITNALLFKEYDAALIDGVASFIAIVSYIYFRKTRNVKIASNLVIAILISVLVVFLNGSENTHYALCWIVVLPPVAYFLFGRKKGRNLVILFFGYMLLFILLGKVNWEPAEFTTESVYNITGTTLSIVLLAGYYEKFREETEDSLLKANAVLEDNKNELRLILDSAAEGIFGIDSDGICTFCNVSCLELLDYEYEDQLIGKNMHTLIHHSCYDGTELPVSECKIHKAILTGEKIYEGDEVFWKSDNTCLHVEYFSYPKYKNDEIIGAVVTFTDISERKKNEERIRYLSRHDVLTGLKNRQSFEEIIKDYDQDRYLPLSIIYGDLNGLKLTNDVFGHAAGDALIKKSAHVLKRVCRKTDIVARIGGDEFVLLLPNTQSITTRQIMERIRKELSSKISSIIQCSMSMGTDTKNDSSQDIEQVLKNAESEMYREKTMVIKNNEKEMVGKLIAELHNRSPREKTHSAYIGELCELMAKSLGWPEAEVKIIRDAGYYHDIGKVILSDKLLHRSEKLTDLEKSERERHVVIGYRILNLFDHTLDLAEPVYYHHEKWDGSGYPKGLSGKEIPIQARIIAIAERYEHITNKSNETPLSTEEALRHIKEYAGTKYDPELVDVLINVMTSNSCDF